MAPLTTVSSPREKPRGDFVLTRPVVVRVRELPEDFRPFHIGVAIVLVNRLRSVAPLPDFVRAIILLGILGLSLELRGDLDLLAVALGGEPWKKKLDSRGVENEPGLLVDEGGCPDRKRQSRDRAHAVIVKQLW